MIKLDLDSGLGSGGATVLAAQRRRILRSATPPRRHRRGRAFGAGRGWHHRHLAGQRRPAEPTAIGGNIVASTGSFTRADGSTGTIADIAFQINEAASRWLGDATISASAALLPQLRGYGTVKDLRVAINGNGTERVAGSALLRPECLRLAERHTISS